MSVFKKNGYENVEQLLDSFNCNLIFTSLKMEMEQSQFVSDSQCPNSYGKYGLPINDSLLLLLQPNIEKITNLSLFPTYSYFRFYSPNEVLLPHRDRHSCEISCSMHIGRFGTKESWPFFIEGSEIIQNIGDCVVYRGYELEHWRKKWIAPPDSLYLQIFLHYVDKNGPFASYKFDNRPFIGTPITQDQISKNMR